MDPLDPAPKLRMAPRETAEEVAQRFQREQRWVILQRETNLEQSLAPFGVRSVRFLNGFERSATHRRA